MWTLGVGGRPLDTGLPPLVEVEEEVERGVGVPPPEGGVGEVEGCFCLRGGARGESASARRL